MYVVSPRTCLNMSNKKLYCKMSNQRYSYLKIFKFSSTGRTKTIYNIYVGLKFNYVKYYKLMTYSVDILFLFILASNNKKNNLLQLKFNYCQ